MQVRRLLRQARTPSPLFVMPYLTCMLYRHVRHLRSRGTYCYSYMHRLVPITRSPFLPPAHADHVLFADIQIVAPCRW